MPERFHTNALICNNKFPHIVKPTQLLNRVLFHAAGLVKLIIHNTSPPNADNLGGLLNGISRARTHSPQPLPCRKAVRIPRARRSVFRLFRGDHPDGPRTNRAAICFRKCVIANQIKMYFRKIKHQLTEVYINEPIESDAEGNALTIADIFSSGVNVEEDVELKIDSEKLYRFIEEELDDREREIICKRYGIPDKNGRVCQPLTQREIAKQLGISRSYISRIEKKALEKLRVRFGE